jgi:hypothetical protein
MKVTIDENKENHKMIDKLSDSLQQGCQIYRFFGEFTDTGTARFSCHLRKSGVKKIEWQEYRAVLFNRGFPSFSYLNYRLIVIQSVLKRNIRNNIFFD